MNRNAIEAVLGMVVLLVAGLFLLAGWSAGSAGSAQTGTGYKAEFNNIDGLSQGALIRLGGVEVGSVTNIALDMQRFMAVIDLNVDETLAIPADSELKIMSDGLLGGKYLQLIPGKAGDSLAAGAKFSKTHDLINLEDLLSRAIFMVGTNN
ncbi:MAG: MlaD family protein [Alphaproteobacteria bacterium]